MSRVAIKICGLSTPETLHAAIKGGAAHVGFVLFAKSPRNVSIDRLAQLSALVPDHVGKIGVMVDPDDMLVERTMPFLDTLQLHGTESPERLSALRARSGKKLWKAIPVKNRNDLKMGRTFAGAADLLLFDAKTPAGTLPGGMGLRFDWTLLAGFDPPLPWGLSGGLDPDNVSQAIRVTGTPMVDVSSGVESAPGVKQVDKIIAFCKAVGP